MNPTDIILTILFFAALAAILAFLIGAIVYRDRKILLASTLALLLLGAVFWRASHPAFLYWEQRYGPSTWSEGNERPIYQQQP